MKNLLRWPTRALAAVLLLLGAACTELPQPSLQEFDPCGEPDHPCTRAGVTPEAQERTSELANLVLSRLGGPEGMAEAVAWLERQPDVASAAMGPDAIRFRVRGGRGTWIFVPAFGDIRTLGAPTLTKPPRAGPIRPVPGAVPAPEFEPAPGLAPRSASHPALPVAPPVAQGTTKGREKRALLLSPFRWQWEIGGDRDGLDDMQRILDARDYEGRVTLLTERLLGSSECFSTDQRWPDCHTVSNIGLDAFTSWDTYDYVHLVTHGGYIDTESGGMQTGLMTSWTEADLESGTGGLDALDGEEGVEDGYIYVWAPMHAVPFVGEGQQVDWDVPLKEILAAERLFGGVPLNPALTAEEQFLCRRAFDQMPDSRRFALAMGGLAQNAPAEEDPGFLEQVIDEISEFLPDDWISDDENSDPVLIREHLATVNGKLCGDYNHRTRTGKFIVLTTAFFTATYPGGIDNAVLFISACSSGSRLDLFNALKGQHTVVIGWKQTVTVGAAAAAGRLFASKLIEVNETIEDDSGLTVSGALRAINEMIEEAETIPPTEAECSAPPNETVQAQCALQYGQVLDVINDQLADGVTGSMLAVVGDTALRAREIVYLTHDDGREFEEGDWLTPLGAPGDGLGDSVDVRIRVDGLRFDEAPGDVELSLIVDEQETEVRGRLDEEVAPGVWELGARVSLGRDHTAGESVDIEVVADLPTGGDSRWLYEDISLSGCGWSATVGGSGVSRSIQGWWGGAETIDTHPFPDMQPHTVWLDGDPQPENPWTAIDLTSVETYPPFSDTEAWEDLTELRLMVPALPPGRVGSFTRVWGSLGVGETNYFGNADYLNRDLVGIPGGSPIGHLLTTNVTITQNDSVRVSGTFNARFLDLERFESLHWSEQVPQGVGIHPLTNAQISASGEFTVLRDGSCSTTVGALSRRRR